jgi:cation diffusion facilitator CzcD-associated flavoprotein CzcO
VDVIVCATGFDTTGAKYIPLTGRNGVKINEKWAKQPVAYNSFAVDDFPNFFLTAGPNIALANGSLILMFEKIVEYAAMCIKKMQREGIKAMVIKKEAVDDWKEYCDNYFPKTVFATKVSLSCPLSDSSVDHGTREVKKMDL